MHHRSCTGTHKGESERIMPSIRSRWRISQDSPVSLRTFNFLYKGGVAQIPTCACAHHTEERTPFRAHEDDLWSVRYDPERAASARRKPMFYLARLNKICPPPPKYSRDTAPVCAVRNVPFFLPSTTMRSRAHAHTDVQQHADAGIRSDTNEWNA